MHRICRKLVLGTIVVAGSAQAAQISLDQRNKAVQQVVASAKECTDLGDFYWEIGDAAQVQASGRVGSDYSPNRIIPIASASKLMFGSYVLEKIGKNVEPSAEQMAALEMQSGYTSMSFMSCAFSGTVESCFGRRHNSVLTPENVGKFDYNGAHDQKLAVDLGLGAMNATEFGNEIRHYLGDDLDISFGSPQPAGGMRVSPADYGKFLRHILAGDLRMKNYLGTHPVCTLPASCTNAISSPVPVAWHYSLNHWVEDDPAGDGAFSSPGAFGFYPWISADQQWYGVLARVSRKPAAYKQSVYCGIKMRKAWLTGT